MSGVSYPYEAGGPEVHGAQLSDPATNSEDPFVTTPLSNSHDPHRFPNFGTHLFALNSSTSPSQAKRALEANIAETKRRIQDASELGTTLLQQEKDLTERLKEVEKQQGNGEIELELRKKLLDLEKEYNEVGRETARTFLGPRPRVSSGESPFPLEGRGPASPFTFSSQATNSPSKLNVPSREQRNQPSSRINEIEFATEISTSLLSQVRHLQALLVERDESIKAINLEKSRMEVEAEGFAQRIRDLGESERRYKDENWSLKTQTHDLWAQVKAASDREQKLTQSLSAAHAEKSTVQRELDELKQFNGKLHEDRASSQKHYELELSSFRRNLTTGETERASLQRKIGDLKTQNELLARAVAGRFKHEDSLDSETVGTLAEHTTPDNSPPPSPTKGTPRHSMLESETLKSSLHHARRMIQNLKANIHREKIEKLELKRMLQEAGDELEVRRGDRGLGGAQGSAAERREANWNKKDFEKPVKLALLGTQRNRKSEIMLDDAGWEDQPAFNTANESDDIAIVSEAPQTGEESLGTESSDDLAKAGTISKLRAHSKAARGLKQSLTQRFSALQEERNRFHEALQKYAAIIEKLDTGLSNAQKQIRVLVGTGSVLHATV